MKQEFYSILAGILALIIVSACPQMLVIVLVIFTLGLLAIQIGKGDSLMATVFSFTLNQKGGVVICHEINSKAKNVCG